MQTGPDTAAEAARPASASIAKLTRDWLSATAAHAHAVTELAVAEAKLAVLSAALMVFFAMLAAVFVLGAWGLVVAGSVHGLLQLGLPLSVALVALGALHVIAAAILWRIALRFSTHLEFKATRRQFERSAEPTS